MSTDDSPEREVLIHDREGFSRGSLEDEEGPSHVSSNENEDVSNSSISTEKPKSRRTPRREVRWLDLGAKNRNLESIKRRFEDRLERFLSSSSHYLLRRVTSPMDKKIRHNLHQCPGYLREEITLSSDVSKSVIVSHAFPSQSEVCSICGELVQYNRTEPSTVDGKKLEAPRYPLQNKLQNKASLSPSSSSPAQSWTLNAEDRVSCQWEDCGEVFTHLATLIHHIHNRKFLLVLGVYAFRHRSWKLRSGGEHFWQTPRLVTLLNNLLIVRLRNLPFSVDHIGVLKSNYACGWTTCGQRGLHLTSRFALIYHIRSHTDKKDSNYITTGNFEFVPSSPQLELFFDYPASESAPFVTSPLPPHTSYDSLDIRFPFE